MYIYIHDIYVCIYVCIYMYVCIYIHIHIYRRGRGLVCGSFFVVLLWLSWLCGGVVVFLCVCRVCRVSSVLCVSESVIYSHGLALLRATSYIWHGLWDWDWGCSSCGFFLGWRVFVLRVAVYSNNIV